VLVRAVLQKDLNIHDKLHSEEGEEGTEKFKVSE